MLNGGTFESGFKVGSLRGDNDKKAGGGKWKGGRGGGRNGHERGGRGGRGGRGRQVINIRS